MIGFDFFDSARIVRKSGKSRDRILGCIRQAFVVALAMDSRITGQRPCLSISRWVFWQTPTPWPKCSA